MWDNPRSLDLGRPVDEPTDRVLGRVANGDSNANLHVVPNEALAGLAAIDGEDPAGDV